MPAAPVAMPAAVVDFRHRRFRRIQFVQDAIAWIDDRRCRASGPDHRSNRCGACQPQQTRQE
jgi:hypothetical protein